MTENTMTTESARGRWTWFGTLIAGIAIATYGFGWLAVPVCAGAWAWIRRGDAAVPLLAGVGGALAWGLLLALGAATGPVGKVGDVVGAAMTVGAGSLYALTIAFPALLAGSAAGVVRGLKR